MDEGAQHPRRAMAARAIRPDERRSEVIDILASGLVRIAAGPRSAQELPDPPAAASESAGGKAPDSAATCLGLSRDPWLSASAGEPAERAPGRCRRAR